jgi:hypothetical protein
MPKSMSSVSLLIGEAIPYLSDMLETTPLAVEGMLSSDLLIIGMRDSKLSLTYLGVAGPRMSLIRKTRGISWRQPRTEKQ